MARTQKAAKVIAVDFDGCLFVDKWPNIGEPIKKNIEHLKREKAKGAKVILWTCREGEMLKQAVNKCADQGIVFDAVNDNLPERINQYGTDPRKVGADEYWDDHAIVMNEQYPLPYKKRRKKHIITDDLSAYKEEEIKIAKQLNYKIDTIEKLKHATTISDIERIMHSARI